MRTVFFGTPEWAVPSLRALLASDVAVDAVVTNPDRPAGRGMRLRASPVKDVAVEAGLEVLQPEKARDPRLKERLQELMPDFATVVAYGKILPGDLLAVPRLGFVNVHFSLLPAYRGAAPVQRAIIEGATETGVSIIVLTEGMDEGPVLAIKSMPIDHDDTAGTVGDRLARIGAEVLVDAVHRYAEGSLKPEEQDHARATYAPKIDNDEARIDWNAPAESVRDLVRGLNPVPGAWTLLVDKRLKIYRVETQAGDFELEPGELAVVSGDLLVGSRTGPVSLEDVQPEGKKRMSGAELARGLRLAGGERLA